jgi:5,10-methenyltetrahydromethanopterin hydrogenase
MALTQAQKAHIYEIQRVAGLCVDVYARAQAVLLAERALGLLDKITQKDLNEAGLEAKLEDLIVAIRELADKQDELQELMVACVKIRAAEINRL